MIRSMTGTGEFGLQERGVELNVFIRSVNQKTIQVQIRMPRILQCFESMIRKEILSDVSRGKIDVSIDVLSLPIDFFRVSCNKGLTSQILDMARQMSTEFGIPLGLTAESILKIPELMTHLPDNQALNGLWPLLQKTIRGAMQELLQARETEGAILRNDLMPRLERLDALIHTIEGLARQQKKLVTDRILTFIRNELNGESFDSGRMDQEIALQAMRADITEEIVRFKSHLIRMNSLMEGSVPAGRTADIVLQELNREINTIGSKSISRDISEAVVDAKVEIDRIREQAQNVE